MAPLDGSLSEATSNNSFTYDPHDFTLNNSFNNYFNSSNDTVHNTTNDPLLDVTDLMEEAIIRNKHQMYIWLIVTGVLCAAVVILWIINVTVFNGGMVRRSVARRCGCRCCGTTPEGKRLNDAPGSSSSNAHPHQRDLLSSGIIPEGRFVRRIESLDRGANMNADHTRKQSRRKGLIWAGFRHNLPTNDERHDH